MWLKSYLLLYRNIQVAARQATMMMMVHSDLHIVWKVGKGLGHGLVCGKFKSAGLKLTINMQHFPRKDNLFTFIPLLHMASSLWRVFVLKHWIFRSLKHDTVPKLNNLYCIMVLRKQSMMKDPCILQRMTSLPIYTSLACKEHHVVHYRQYPPIPGKAGLNKTVT